MWNLLTTVYTNSTCVESICAGPTFGFTKANELFVGRLAQLGIAFSIIGEVVTGKGTLAQLNIETGVPITEIEPLILFNVVFFLIAAVNPGTGKFVSDDDVEWNLHIKLWFSSHHLVASLISLLEAAVWIRRFFEEVVLADQILGIH